MQAVLILQDGSIYRGQGFGAEGKAFGELVSYSCMMGYQEVMTDPAHYGKLVVLTYPMVGSYGVNSQDNQGGKIWANALIVREYVDKPSNFRCEGTLGDRLKQEGKIGISGVDTRALVKQIRDNKSMKAVVACGDKLDEQALLKELENVSIDAGIESVTAKEVKTYPAQEEQYKVALIDLGTKKSVISIFNEKGASVTVFPAGVNVDKLSGFEGIVLSGGAGDPQEVAKQYPNLKELDLLHKPILAIDMGHLVTALNHGFVVYKLDQAHRAASHPVKNLETDRVYPTAQSHAYAVDRIDGKLAQITYVSMNDNSNEGLFYRSKNILSVQFCPDANPKEYGTGYIYDQFLSSIQK